MPRYLGGTLVELVVGLACSCAAATEGPASRQKGPVALEASRIGSGFAAIWINTDLQPIGQLTTVGGTTVGLAVDSNHLYLIAIDPVTGNLRWRQRTTPSMVTIGVPAEVIRIGDDKVAYLRPVERSYAQLIVADATTGRDLAKSPPAVFHSWPYACKDGQDACAISCPMPGTRTHQYRLRTSTSEYDIERRALPPYTRVLEPPSLFDLGDRPGNTLGWLRDGELRWQVPMDAVFSPGFSSDYGWLWREFTSSRVLVGSVRGAPAQEHPKRVYDLERSSATAGISVDTGKVLWRDEGSDFECFRFLANRGAHPVRCRKRGSVTFPIDGPASFEIREVILEGFEPTTGKTTWSIPMGQAHELVDHEAPLAVAGATNIVLSSPAGRVIVDYATGSVTAPTPGSSYWCLTYTRYEILPAFTAPDGSRHYDRPGGQLAVMCDEQGRGTEKLPWAEATIAAGARAGAHAVIAGRHGYVGFRIP